MEISGRHVVPPADWLVLPMLPKDSTDLTVNLMIVELPHDFDVDDLEAGCRHAFSIFELRRCRLVEVHLGTGRKAPRRSDARLGEHLSCRLLDGQVQGWWQKAVRRTDGHLHGAADRTVSALSDEVDVVHF